MNKAILDISVQQYIQDNLNADVVGISLSKSPFPDVSSKELAQQIDGKKRCESKLPLWYNTPGIYYPEKLALEQCSSELTGKYKTGLILGKRIIDLTGGFGVDANFFSEKAGRATHCEINRELSDISNHNSQVLGIEVHHLHIDGIEHLKRTEDLYDTIYIDPSRRLGSRKVFMLQDCEPNVISVLQLLLERSERIIIKTAPLLDLQATIKELGNVTAVHILSIKNECKEVLYIIDKASCETDPPINCAIVKQDEISTFTFQQSAEKAFSVHQYSGPLAFLYEPDVSLLKGGCFKLITREFNVKKLHQHTHLYTSNHLAENFMGRKFTVLNTSDYGTFIKTHRFKKANIICRNFPQNPNQIREKLRISDGGNDYLLFCTGPNNELLVIHCDRIV